MGRKKPKKSTAGESGAIYDRCYTPWHGVAPILPYLPPRSRIWECAAGDGWITRVLVDAGHTVISTDYRDGFDFFKYAPDPDQYDIILTNPPYSLKYKFMRRCYDLGKRWALLMPSDTAAAGTALAMYEQYGWEELRLTRRINFSMPETGFRNKGAQFATWWFCWGLLPKPIVVATPPQPLPHERLIKVAKEVAELPQDELSGALTGGLVESGVLTLPRRDRAVLELPARSGRDNQLVLDF